MTEELIITKLFSRTAAQFAEQTSLQIKKDSRWLRFSYKELETLSLKVSAFLLREGFKKGEERCAIILENRPEWAIIYLGIVYAGLTCVPLDPEFCPEEIKNLIEDSATKVIFSSYDLFVNKLKSVIAGSLIKSVVLDAAGKEDEGFYNFSDIKNIPLENISWPVILPQDIVSLIYTSGTTGKPKGVMLTHKNICSNFLSTKGFEISSSSDNFLSILPLHHTYPFMGNLILPLLTGATITYPPSGFRPQELSRVIKETQVTILVGVPQLFALLHAGISERLKRIPVFLRPLALIFVRRRVLEYFGKTLRYLISGGACLEPKIARDLTKWGFKIIEGYGLTETSPIVTLNPPQKVKFGSAGKPIPGVQIRILNPQSSGIGQILINGPNVMQGYFKQPELTAEVLKDDWFYSGDLGYIDKDGYLFITGREKEVIVLSSGKTLYPEELENYYGQSPYIKEICVLQKSEERFGHLIDSLFAVVVPDLEYFQQKNVMNIRAKIRWELENLAKALPSYRHIMGFTLTKEALPRTALAKIKRYEVREKYLFRQPALWGIEEVGLSEEDKRVLSQDFAQKIMQYLSGQLKKPIYLDSHLEIDLGIDSLTRVELALGLEALLSLKIPDAIFYDVFTVRDVIMRIQEIIQNLKPYAAKVIQKSWGEILREEPREEILQKIRIRPRIIDWVIAYIFKSMFLPIFRIFWLLRLKAVGNLPKGGPYLICPNHASFLDGFVVFSSLPLKLAINTYFVGFSYIFEYPLFKWALKSARLLPIDPDINLTDAMQTVSFLLSHKKIVCIFPEGLRSVDERVKEFKKGVGILIKELDIPVVPVYIKGSHQSWPRTSSLPKPYPLKVIFGRPHLKKELLKQTKEAMRDDYEAIAQELREELLKLANDI